MQRVARSIALLHPWPHHGAISNCMAIELFLKLITTKNIACLSICQPSFQGVKRQLYLCNGNLISQEL